MLCVGAVLFAADYGLIYYSISACNQALGGTLYAAALNAPAMLAGAVLLTIASLATGEKFQLPSDAAVGAQCSTWPVLEASLLSHSLLAAEEYGPLLS